MREVDQPNAVHVAVRIEFVRYGDRCGRHPHVCRRRSNETIIPFRIFDPDITVRWLSRLRNSFETRICRSRPADPGFERIPETAQPPDSYIRVKDAERDNCFVRPPAAYVRMTPAPVTIPYKLDPDRDVNGVGLIYFAHFPVFLDIAERQVLRTAELPLSEELIDRRTLIRRSSAYLGNAST